MEPDGRIIGVVGDPLGHDGRLDHRARRRAAATRPRAGGTGGNHGDGRESADGGRESIHKQHCGCATHAAHARTQSAVQKTSRSAICICRDVPVPIVRFTPLDTRPKVASVVKVVGGVAAWVRLNRLNMSVRRTIAVRSDMRVLFWSEKSTWARPGPVAMARPALPHVRLAGIANAAGLNHWAKVRPPAG